MADTTETLSQADAYSRRSAAAGVTDPVYLEAAKRLKEAEATAKEIKELAKATETKVANNNNPPKKGFRDTLSKYGQRHLDKAMKKYGLSEEAITKLPEEDRDILLSANPIDVMTRKLSLNPNGISDRLQQVIDAAKSEQDTIDKTRQAVLKQNIETQRTQLPAEPEGQVEGQSPFTPSFTRPNTVVGQSGFEGLDLGTGAASTAGSSRDSVTDVAPVSGAAVTDEAAPVSGGTSVTGGSTPAPLKDATKVAMDAIAAKYGDYRQGLADIVNTSNGRFNPNNLDSINVGEEITMPDGNKVKVSSGDTLTGLLQNQGVNLADRKKAAAANANDGMDLDAISNVIKDAKVQDLVRRGARQGEQGNFIHGQFYKDNDTVDQGRYQAAIRSLRDRINIQ